MADSGVLRRVIAAADCAGVAVDPRVVAGLARVDELAAEQAGEDFMGAYRRGVVATVVERILDDKPPAFAETWASPSLALLTTESWRAKREAMDAACDVLLADLLDGVSAGLRKAWGPTLTEVRNAHRLLGGDVSVGNALSRAKPAQQGLAAVERLRALVDLARAILDATPNVRQTVDEGYMFGIEHPVDWTAEPLALLGSLGDVECADPIEALTAAA